MTAQPYLVTIYGHDISNNDGYVNDLINKSHDNNDINKKTIFTSARSRVIESEQFPLVLCSRTFYSYL